MDCEYIGELLVGKMLKVSLESGSYLVEAKHYNGKSMGKYELRITSTDTQLVENISKRINCQDEIVRELSNDSSLHFYHHRALFCYNGNYGYINSRYEIVIEPIYSFAEDFINKYAIVKKLFPDGEKATLIDIDGKICLDRWYEYIGSSKDTVLLYKDDVFYVVSKIDCSIIKEYLNANYNKEGELIPVHQYIGIDDMYGFIDKTGKEIIPFIYDYVWNFDKKCLAKVKRFGHSELVVDLEGNLYRNKDVAIDTIKSKEKNRGISSLLSIDIRDDYGPRDVGVLTKEESIYMGFSSDCYCYENYYPFKIGNNWGLAEWNLNCRYEDNICSYTLSNTISRYKCDRIILLNCSSEYQYIVFRTQNICKLIYQEWTCSQEENKENIFSIEADEIFPIFYKKDKSNYYCDIEEELKFVVIKRNKKYGIVDVQGKIILDLDYDYIEPTCANIDGISGDIAIIKKGGMFSLVSISRRKILLPFKYEEITPTYASDSYDSSYIVKENGKYGIIDIHGKIILPLEYDGIKHEFLFVEDYRHLSKSILQRGEKYGLWLREHYYISDGLGQEKRYRDLRIEAKYDECIFVDSADYNKYGSDIAVRCGMKWTVITSANMYKNFMNVLDDLEFNYKSLDDILYERTSQKNDRNLDSVGFFNV